MLATKVKLITRTISISVVCIIASLQMFGYVIDNKVLRAIGAASLISPYTKVFSDVDGLETFASKFIINYKDDGGEEKNILITPELYSNLSGPYNRRNIYGAAISYAPKLPSELWKPVIRYGFNGPLLAELGLPDSAKCATITIISQTKNRPTSYLIDGEQCK